MRRGAFLVLGMILAVLPATPLRAGDRVPAGHWMQYADPGEAGFDAGQLEAARLAWTEISSSAFLVVVDGAVLVAWGDVERRFMCHSVRKSFLSALYGIYWDRGQLELNKTLADLGIDDEPSPLLATEKRARILDLLKARSGVFHPAAYAGRTDSRPRGSQGPGRFFAYNNWDVNTRAAILEQETGVGVFDAFDEHFALPLGMTDWRISDGYYHLELDKSMYPAYPFRMSARDAARFGLLFARQGQWGESRILSRHWMNRSLALYSIDNAIMGYGFMWWVLREPRFSRYGMVSALGVGNQMIAALPEIDMVIVNRANTYANENTPLPALLDLIEQILDARAGPAIAEPVLVPLEDAPPDPRITGVSQDLLAEFVGTWAFPPASLGLTPVLTLEVSVVGGHLEGVAPKYGTYRLYLQADGTVRVEDSLEWYAPIRDADGNFEGFADAASVARAAMTAVLAAESDRADELLALVEAFGGAPVAAMRAVIHIVRGEEEEAEQLLRNLEDGSAPLEFEINRVGLHLSRSGEVDLARSVLELCTRLYPTSFNAWDSLGEANLLLGDNPAALRCYERSLELNEGNANARQRISRLRSG